MNYLPEIAIYYIILLASVVIHEFGHAWMANRLGDPLPRTLGRVTLNPQVHIDLWGTILIPLMVLILPVVYGSGPFLPFAWGKRVETSSMPHATRKRFECLTNLAGPIANLLIGILAAILAGLFARFGIVQFDELFLQILRVNLFLLIFNLIPIPPLKGSFILKILTNMSDLTFAKFSQWGMLLFILLFWIGPFGQLLHILEVYGTSTLWLVRLLIGGL